MALSDAWHSEAQQDDEPELAALRESVGRVPPEVIAAARNSVAQRFSSNDSSRKRDDKRK
jgi:hypothetical protein